ncbi:MAG: hypothetical protein KIT16_04270, partial [Rhodospirillaceae bacterium]|nr:hypothetical protein [Rhodospirillaceae bacterium]
RRFAQEHGSDPQAESKPMPEQNRLIDGWVRRNLAPAVAHAQLPPGLADDVLDLAARNSPGDAALTLQQSTNALAGAGRRRIAEDGQIGPETLAATRAQANQAGVDKLRENFALTAFRRGLDAMLQGSGEPAPDVFRRSVGRLYRDVRDDDGENALAADRAAPVAPRHEEVAALQDTVNDANRVYGVAENPLVVDGVLGPKTAAALGAAARAAGAERLADHLGKRLGIGDADLMDNPARGFAYALAEDGDEPYRGSRAHG